MSSIDQVEVPPEPFMPAERQAQPPLPAAKSAVTAASAVPGQTAATAGTGSGAPPGGEPSKRCVDSGVRLNTDPVAASADAIQFIALPPTEPPPPPRVDLPAGGPPSANPSGTCALTLADVQQYTLQHNPSLRIRQHEIEAAQARVITARLLPNPQLTLDSMNSTGGSDEERSVLTARIMMTVPLQPKRRLRTNAATVAVCEARLAFNREAKLVLAEATDAAIEVLYLQELRGLYAQLADLAEQGAQAQQERFKVAAAPYRNVIFAQLSAYRLEMAGRDTAIKLDQARVRLARAMGIVNGSLAFLDGQVSVEPLLFPPLPEVLAQACQAAPQLAQSAAAIEESRERHALERAKAVPDLSVGVRARESLSGAEADQLGGRLQVDLPIFDRNQGRIAESAAEIEISSAKHDVLEISTLDGVASLYLSLQKAQSSAEFYSLHVRPLAAETEAAVREAFQSSAVNAFELAELLETVARVRLEDLDVRYQHQRLRARLELLLERPLPRFAEVLPAGPPAK